MAGYEYVSPEQLAGFDKYKVARGPADAPLPPGPGLSQAAERQARSVSPCAAWLWAGWPAFPRGSCRDPGLWGQSAWEHPRLAALTRCPPGGIAFTLGDLSTGVEPENSLRSLFHLHHRHHHQY